jgi:hypothetical protein
MPTDPAAVPATDPAAPAAGAAGGVPVPVPEATTPAVPLSVGALVRHHFTTPANGDVTRWGIVVEVDEAGRGAVAWLDAVSGFIPADELDRA